jgi:hypothetical protein
MGDSGGEPHVEDLMAAVALRFMNCNFCWVRKSLNGKAPAASIGVAGQIWSIQEVIGLLGSN